MSQVIVYFYSGRWVTIMFCSLGEAIALHHRARLAGRELFVFSPEVNPRDGTCNTLLTPLHAIMASQPQTKIPLQALEKSCKSLSVTFL